MEPNKVAISVKTADITWGEIMEIFSKTKLGKSNSFTINSVEYVKTFSDGNVLLRLKLSNGEKRNIYGRIPTRDIVIEINKAKQREKKLNILFDGYI